MLWNRKLNKRLARRRLRIEVYERRELLASDFRVVDINRQMPQQLANGVFDYNGVALLGVNAAIFESDGTDAGTTPSPIKLSLNATKIGSDFYYYDTLGTYKLSSDGTSTQLLNWPGSIFTQLGSQVFFVARGELWKTDGTTDGTVMVKDIRPGFQEDSNPRQLTAVGDKLFFFASDNETGVELWKSDGTEAGTVLVLDRIPGPGSGGGTNLTVFKDRLFYVVADPNTLFTQLVTSDGTAEGTIPFSPSILITENAAPIIVGKNDDRLFFSARTVVQIGSQYTHTGQELFSTDGTDQGTVLVKDINPGAGFSNPGPLTPFNDGFLFIAASSGDLGRQDVELWRTDGTESGTYRVKDINPAIGSANPTNLTVANNVGYFFADDGVHGSELWRTDGTSGGTQLVADLTTGSASTTASNMMLWGNKLFFFVESPAVDRGWWVSDGTTSGTIRLASATTTASSSPTQFAGSSNGDLVAVANDSLTGPELWYINSSGVATLAKDVFPGVSGSSVQSIVRVKSNWFFAANDGVNGLELWKTDGTTNGTNLVKDIRLGTTGSSISQAIAVGDRLFFTANNGIHGTELWVSDGSNAGTSLVADITPGASSTALNNFTSVGNVLYFTASTSATGQELWRSDGTADGTYLVKDIYPGTNSSSIYSMANVQGMLFFGANNGQVGNELWKSDGTEQGTVLVKDISAGATSANVNTIHDLNGLAVFLARDPINGNEWWTSDGTTTGTKLIRNLAVGSAGFVSGNLSKVVGPYLYFWGDDRQNRYELWRTDGTADGTFMLTDTPFASTYVDYLENVQGTLYFRADDQIRKSDGTFAGTVQLPTPFGAPSLLTASGNKLFLAGDSGAKGREPIYLQSPAVSTDIAVSKSRFAENLPAGTTIGALETASAVANQTYTYSLVSGDGSEDNGKFSIVNGQLVANISADYEVQSRYRIRIRSTPTQGQAIERVLVIDVTNINERPVVLSQQLSTTSGTSKQISLLGSDPEGRALVYSITQFPKFGTLQPSGTAYLYVPNPGFVGTDEFYFQASDGSLTSTEARVGISVTGVIPSVTFQSNFTVASEAIGTANLQITLSAAQPADLIIPVSQFGGSLKANKDFFASANIVIPAGSSSAVLPISVVDDDIDDDDEFMIFDLIASAQGLYTLGTFSRTTFQVTDNDGSPTISIATSSQVVSEGQSNLKVDVILSAEAGKSITVPILTSGGAAFNSDYVVSTGSQAVPPLFIIPSGSRTATFYVSIIDDPLPEADENFTLTIGTPINNSAFVGTPASVTYTIAASDTPVVNFLESSRKVNESQGTVVVTAYLLAPAPSTITVPFTMSGDLALGTDYTIDRNSFVFAPGAQTATATITLIDESIAEVTDESLALRLSPSSAYVIGRAATTTLTVSDNDYSQVSFAAPVIDSWEDAGTVVLTVTNSKPSSTALTVPFSVQLGGPMGYAAATRDQDYSISTHSVVFPPLASAARVTVTITNDSVNETPETLSLKLLPPQGVFSTTASQATVFIQDDDPLATFSQTYVAAVESSSTASFRVSVSAPSNKSITLPFALTGTAIAGVDYTRPVPQQITIAAGQTSGSVTIPLLQDINTDGFKTLSIDLLPPINALLGAQNTRAVLSIADDDTAPTLSMSAGTDLIDLRVRSGIQEGNRTGTVKVNLSSPANRDVTVAIQVQGNATLGVDYVLQGLVNNQITIPAGSTEASFSIRTIDDAVVESEELITLALDRPSNATLSSAGYLMVSIMDDDVAYSTPVQPTAPTTPTEACPLTNTNALTIPSCMFPGGSPGSYSPTGGTTTTIGSQTSPAGTLSIPVIVASQGLLNEAIGFMDANFNNVPDFLDLNSNGVQDDGEPNEPVAHTLSDGMTAFSIPPEMDKNHDGVIGTDEAHFVVSGGTDTSTGLLVSGTLSAPMGVYALTSLTTMIDIAVRGGLSVSVATERLQTALRIDGYNLNQGVSLQESLAGNSLAAKAYLSHVQVYTSALLIANFVSGLGNSAFSIDQLVNLAYEEFARTTSSESGSLNLASTEIIAASIDAVAARSGIAIDSQLTSVVSSVIAGGIQVQGSYVFDTFASGKAYLEQLVRAKKVLQGEAAIAIQSVGQSSSQLTDFVAGYTGQSLFSKINGAQPLVISPAVVVISDATQVEGNSGQTTLQFVVRIVGDHPSSVDVGYRTSDFTATELDYTSIAGSLHWDAGDNSPRTINVLVNSDNDFEADELVKLDLLPSTTVAIRRPTGFGFILNDDALVQTAPVVESGVSKVEYSPGTGESTLSTPDKTLFRGLVTDPIQAIFDGRAGQDDQLIVNYSNRSYRDDVIQFRGESGVDEFQLIGGRFATMNFYVGTTVSDVTLVTNDSSDSVSHTIQATIESTENISLRPGEIDTITVEFPFTTTGIVIEDADVSSSGATRIRSLNNQFSPLTITNPSQRLRVIVHNRATTIASAPDGDLTGRVDVIGSFDDTAPRSQIQSLQAIATSTSLTVQLSSNDPAGAVGSWISGSSEYDLYVAIDNGPFTRHITLPVSTTSFSYPATGNHYYFFRTIARDQAGNTESKTGYDTYTYVGDLLKPVSSIVTATHNTNGLFSLIASGNDVGGSTLASFDFYVQVDSASAIKIGTVNASPQVAGATATASMSYQAIVDGSSHTYRFFSVGRDAVGNIEDAPAVADQTVSASFSGGLSATGIDVQSGARQRSFINRVDLFFNSTTGLTDLLSANRIAVERFDLLATSITPGSGVAVPISTRTLSGNRINLSFGNSGLANDGFYRIRVDTNGDGDMLDVGEAFEFYRLRGDANGDAVVNELDTAVVDSLFGRVGTNLDGDLDGNGSVNATDRNYTLRTYRGKKLADDLKQWLDD